jgi:WD40 repeat protein
VGAVDGPYAHLWDAAAGQISFTVKGKELTLLPERRFLLVANPERRIYAVDLTTGQIHRTPLVPPATNAIEQAPWMLDYGSSGTILLQVGAVEGPSSPDSLPSIVVWSLDSGKIGRVDRFLSGGDWQFEVSQDGSRLIANQFEPGNFQPKLWDVKTGAPIASLITAGKNTEKDFRINERFSLIVTRSPLDDEGTTQQFALWELADGAPTGKSAIHDMGDLPVSPTLKMDLSRNGNWVFRGGGREAFEPIELVDGRTLKALADLKGGARGWWLDEGLFLLEEAGHASMWDIETERRIGLQGIDTRRITSAAVSGDRTGAVLVSTDGSASLWDLQRGSKVRELPLPSRPRRVQRSLDGRFILVTLASGQVQVLSFQYGERIAELNDAGFENDWEAYVDMACKRINVWTIDGRVLQYREQLYMFGRPWIVDESCP